MSLGGEIMECHYDGLIISFLEKLVEKLSIANDMSYQKSAYSAIDEIIEEYKKHFRNNGIYGG